MVPKFLFIICSLSFLVGAYVPGADAGIDVNVSMDAPPPLYFADQPGGQPDLVVIPSGPEYIYMVPDMSGVYFYRGMWYRFYDGAWFRSPAFDGTWIAVPPQAIPVAVINMPPEYPLYLPPDYYRIRYHDAFVRWREWETIRHWRHYEWFNNETRPEVIESRRHEIEKERRHETHHEIERGHSALQPEGQKHIEGRQEHEVERLQREFGKPGEPGQRLQTPQKQQYSNKPPQSGPPAVMQGQHEHGQRPEKQTQQQLQTPHRPGQAQPQKQTQPQQLQMPHRPGQGQPEKQIQPQPKPTPENKAQPQDRKREDNKENAPK